MKVAKIEHPYKTCENCEKEKAQYNIGLGTKSLQFSLCEECAWNLADMLNETPHLSFQSAER